MLNNKKKILFPIWILLQLIALFITGYIAIFNTRENILVLLPASFIMVSIFYYRLYAKLFASILCSFYIFTAYVRFVISPFFLILTDYNMDFFMKSEIFYNLNSAILLMVYEIFIIFSILYLYLKKNDDFKISTMKFEQLSRVSNFIIISLSVILGIILIIYPQMGILLHANSSVVEEQWLIKDMVKELHNTLNPYVYWGGRLAIQLLQVILPIYIYNWAYIKLTKNKSMLIGSALVFLSLIIMTNVKAMSIFVATTLLIIIIVTQKEKAMKYVPVLFCSIAIVFLAALTKDQGFTNNQIAHISTVIQGYFASPIYTSGALLVDTDLDITEIFKDVLTPMPFFGMFVKDFISTNELVNSAMFGNSVYGIICPMLGEGNRLVTPVFAPIFSAITILIGITIEKHFKRKINSSKISMFEMYFYCYVLIVLGVAVNMYDFSILMGFFSTFIITYFIIYAPKVKNIHFKF